MPAPQFFPAVSNLVNTSSLPEPIKSAFENVSDKLFYKTYYVEKSIYGDSAYHHLVFVFKGHLSIGILGGDNNMELLINSGAALNTVEIPIVLYYNLPILKYLRQFKLEDLGALEDYFNLILEMFDVSQLDLIYQTLDVFLNGYEEPITTFVDQFNNNPDYSQFQPLAVPQTGFYHTDTLSLIDSFEGFGLNMNTYILETYIDASDLNESFENLSLLFERWLGEFNMNTISELFIPKVSASIDSLNLALAFSRTWLLPVDANGDVIEGEERAMLTYTVGSLKYDTVEGFDFINPDTFSLTPSQIGNTGLILEVSNLKLDLKDDSSISEAAQYGYGPEFKGIYAQFAAITLPKRWFENTENNPNTTARLAGYDILVGTGGFSGRLALEVIDGTSDPLLVKTVGTNGFEVGFSAFDINFDRNKIVSSNILGQLKIPRLKDSNGNDAEIDIFAHLDSDGDFLITASEQDGFAPIEIPGVFKLYIQGIELGQEDDNFFIGTAAELEFTNAVMNKLLCNDAGGENVRIALPAIRIYSNGGFEIVGGGIPLPTNFSICLGPAKMSITNLNFTSHQQEYNGVLREYKCWGFDGALNLNPLGVEVRGDGVRYHYTVDDDVANGKPHHSYVRISTIEVDIIIPGNASPSTATAIINGYLSIPEPGVSTEYAGGISIKLPQLGVSGSAEMRLQPSYPAFILDANLEIPIPIPLASTGLGVFGFRGLLGYRYVAEKEAIGLTSGEDSWYDYYVYPERGININKFSGPEQTTNYKNPISIGAGASIATYGNDSIISFRVFMLLSIPSLFFIEGKASIISKRLELDDTDEPPFYAFLAIGDDSIEAGLGADFRIPQNNGWILDLQAKVEAGFFFNNPSAWYINFGTRQEPISARLLTLLTAQTYLQLSARGIETGARAEFDFEKKFGPIRVRAYAYVEVGGFISFERPQMGGYLAAGGEATIDVKIITISVALDLIFGVEAARPFLIYGKFRLCVKVKLGFFKVKFCLQVELKWEKSREIDRTPIPIIAQERVLELAKGVHMLTGDSFDLVQLNTNITDPNYVPSANNSKFNNTVFPLDTYIDIKFAKPLNPNPVSGKTAGVNNGPQNFIELIPPQKTVRGKEVRQVKHAYSMEDIEVKAWNGSAWLDYNPYEVIVTEGPVIAANLKLGHWQKTGKEYNALRILGDNPFSFTQLGEPGWYVPERLGITASSLFCETVALAPECANWLKKSTDVKYLAYFKEENSFDDVDNLFTVGRMAFLIRGPIFIGELGEYYNASVVIKPNAFNFDKSLEFYNFMAVEIRLPNPSKQLTFKLSTIAEGVTFSFYRSVINDLSLDTQYALVGTLYKTRSQLNQEVVYENANEGISLVLIQPDFLQVEQINALNEELQAYYEQAFDDFIDGEGGEIVLTDHLDNEQVENKKQDIINLIQSGCAGQIPGGVLSGGIGFMQIGSTFIVGAKDVVLDSIQEYTNCTTMLHEVCWLSEADYEFNVNIPAQAAIQEDYVLTEDAISKVVAPIWRPDTKYYIHFKLKDTVDGDASGTAGDYHYYYGFRTAGPVGHFHNAQGVGYGGDRDGNGNLIAPDKYPLTNLRKYIDYNRSYPNADGNLLRSKPLFYSNAEAKLQLFFVRPQAFHMFNTWPALSTGFSEIPSEMKIIIKDPVNDTLIPYPLPQGFDETTIPGGIESWDEDTMALMPTYLKHWNNLVAAQDTNFSCLTTGGEPIRPKSKKRTIILTNLKPRKLYTALVNNVYNDTVVEVHNYGFQTSRYANFTEQVNSYLLSDGEGNESEAVFKIQLDLSTTQIDSAFSLVEHEGTPDSAAQALEDKYVDYFDRVMEGVFGLRPLPSAETTEFNAIVDQSTGDTVALLIRNPEPFNDPKIPESEIRETIKILNTANNEPDSNYHILFSKDCAQVLVMHINKRITNNALRVRFQYFLWDGGAYIVNDTVLVEGLNINL